MYDYVFTIEFLSTGSTAVDFLLVAMAVFVLIWVIKFLWSFVVGG